MVRYVDHDELLQLHYEAIARFGGLAGVRDQAALEASLAQPQMAVFGVERFPTLIEKAAAYCYFLILNHPFFDGNKRTAVAAAVHFLLENGTAPHLDDDLMYQTVVSVASGTADMQALVDVFALACQPTQ